MEKTILARVVAKAINFPNDLEMSYICLDSQERQTGETYGGVHFTWDQVKARFWIDVQYAAECEDYFRNGDPVFIGIREVVIQV